METECSLQRSRNPNSLRLQGDEFCTMKMETWARAKILETPPPHIQEDNQGY
jgi:hypothetical protein